MPHTSGSTFEHVPSWELPRRRARRLHFGCSLGQAPWLVCFGRSGLPGAEGSGGGGPLPRAFVSLHIDGIAPQAVYRVQVTRGNQRLFDIGAFEGRSGHVSSAGEILTAMAAVMGGTGMSIPGEELGPVGAHPPLAVRLCLLAADVRGTGGVRVRARLA
jgi:hypothetical protein